MGPQRAKFDIIGEGIKSQPRVIGRGQGKVGRNEDAHVAGVVERRSHDLRASAFRADANLKWLDASTYGERRAREQHARFAAQQCLAQVGGDVDRSGSECDDVSATAGALDPMHVILRIKGEKTSNAAEVTIEPRALIEEFISIFSVL